MSPGVETPHGSSASRHVLLVEDDAGLRSLIVKHLEALGCRVDAAATAESAHAILAAARHPYHAIIADVHLGDGSGVSVVRAAQVAQPRIPVIFITGDGDSRVASEALTCNPAGYLLKPFELTELDAIVLHVLRQPRDQESHDAPVPVRPDPVSLDDRSVLLSKEHERPGPPFRLYVRIALIVLIILAASFVVGYAINRAIDFKQRRSLPTRDTVASVAVTSARA